MKNQIEQAIILLETVAKEYHEIAETYRNESKRFAAEYSEGKAYGIEEAAALVRIATTTTIPFEE